MLRAISGSDVNRIQSAQVITSLADATKELVENAIDAGASRISVRFRNYGLDLLEVSDNGPGIAESELELLVAKHATSKLSSFDDLEGLGTLGFRGEALSSLCALSVLSITTCTQATYPKALSLAYQRDGTPGPKKIISAQVGTTMSVENLFEALPVRRKDFEKNAKRDFVKTTRLLQAYAAVHPEIRMEAVALNGNSRSQLLGRNGTTGRSSMKNNLIDIFSVQLGRILTEVDTKISFQDTHRRKKELTTIHIEGYVSSPQREYGGQPDRQLIYINSRPCQLPKMIKCINESFSTLGANRSPFIMLNFKMPPDSYDVNVSPDKTTIFVHDEQIIVQHLRDAIEQLFTDDSREIKYMKPLDQGHFDGTDGNHHGLSARFTMGRKPESDGPSPLGNSKVVNSGPVGAAKDDSEDDTAAPEVPSTDNVPDNTSDIGDIHNAEPVPSQRKETTSAARASDAPSLSSFRLTPIPDKHQSASGSHSLSKRALPPVTRGVPKRQALLNFNHISPDEAEAREDALSTSEVADDAMSLTSDSEHEAAQDAEERDRQPRSPISMEEGGIQADTSHARDSSEVPQSPVKPLQRFISRLNNLDRSPPSHHVHNHSITLDTRETILPQPGAQMTDSADVACNANLAHAGVSESADVAEQVLTLNVSKSDFFRMTVIGQFNLGFIIVTKDKELFIVDQHASDEKSNYERLLRETVIQTQQLARPKELDLTAIEKLSIDEHISTLDRNGFGIVAREPMTESPDEFDKRYWLTSVPVSKNITFDLVDLREILDLLIHGSPAGSVRCTKAKRQFASRACRSSIMIGTALTRDRMQAVIWHLGEMDAPWNCPHGRPTMRHLTNFGLRKRWRADYDPV